jgi:hypothetical protein
MFSVRMRKFRQTALFTLLALPFAAAMAAPVGYSVNSDQPLGDKLYSIDLADGTTTGIGIGVKALSDIEGLAFAPDTALWGVDEESGTLFQIDTGDGTIVAGSELTIKNLDSPIRNDFGLTFTCDGTLYTTSVLSQTLYTLDNTGNASPVGGLGSLGVNISAIAARGNNPAKLYGLGNGLLRDNDGQVIGPDNRSLYEIDTSLGTTTHILSLGDAVADYDEAGLAFDAGGNLWAITDRSRDSQFSQILSIDLALRSATVEATTSVIGFESLAIAPPANCEPSQIDDKYAREAEPIPSLKGFGSLIAILALMLSGFTFLRQRHF